MQKHKLESGLEINLKFDKFNKNWSSKHSGHVTFKTEIRTHSKLQKNVQHNSIMMKTQIFL